MSVMFVKRLHKTLLFGVLSVLFLGISACGFHLKGTANGGAQAVAFDSIRILESNGVRSDFMQVFRQALKSSGVKQADSLADAQVSISFSPTAYQTTRTGISGDGDTSSELVKMSQSFSSEIVATEAPLLTTTLVTLRDRQVDASAALASNRELQQIQRQMASELALQVIDRLNRAWVKAQADSK